MKYGRGEGDFWSLGYSGGSSDGVVEKYQVAAPAMIAGSGAGGGGATLVRDSSTATSTYTPPWTFTFSNGEQRIFDATTGNLLSIVDRNGNTTTINYDAQNRIRSVADPAGHTLTFNYSDAVNPGQVTSIGDGCTTCPGGSTIATYQYFQDGTARLQKVTYADGSSVTFQYNDPSSNLLISAVVDGAGKVLEAHSYDANARGVTSSQAQGVNAVTVSYPQ
jgi:YD repeat-containing protein